MRLDTGTFITTLQWLGLYWMLIFPNNIIAEKGKQRYII
jgi:hypothetical protein